MADLPPILITPDQKADGFRVRLPDRIGDPYCRSIWCDFRVIKIFTDGNFLVENPVDTMERRMK